MMKEIGLFWCVLAICKTKNDGQIQSYYRTIAAFPNPWMSEEFVNLQPNPLEYIIVHIDDLERYNVNTYKKFCTYSQDETGEAA